MAQSTVHVGMDVHQDSVVAAVLPEGATECEEARTRVAPAARPSMPTALRAGEQHGRDRALRPHRSVTVRQWISVTTNSNQRGPRVRPPIGIGRSGSGRKTMSQVVNPQRVTAVRWRT